MRILLALDLFFGAYLLPFAAAADQSLAELGYSTIAQASDALAEPLKDGRADDGQYNAFYYLVASGRQGWNVLIERLADITVGDTARKVDTFWSGGGIPHDVTDEFLRFRKGELARRARENETWAMMFAAAYIRTDYHARRKTFVDELDEHFKAVRELRQRPAEALLDVAFLRARFVPDKRFPGHNFPWSASPAAQKDAIADLLSWWKSNRPRYVEDGQ